jgi:hypothetical protein
MKNILLSVVLLASVSVNAVAGPIYLRSVVDAPWGVSTNEDAMDGVFGAGNWSDLRYETVDTSSLFSAVNHLIYMEGSDNNADELEAFIGANQIAMENWVANGGRLLLNAAPNEGDGMAFGFGISLNYEDYGDSVTAADPAHAIFNGPFGVTGSAFTGSSFSHASVSGAGLNALILDEDLDAVLAEMVWGKGLVLFGGMTTSNFQTPNAFELRENILYYTANTPLQTQSVPAPAGLLVLVTGIAGLVLVRRKR